MAKVYLPLDGAASRYHAGSVACAEHYKARCRPFHELMRSLKLPPRGPVGSKRNKRRGDILRNALHRLSVKLSREARRRRRR